MHEGILAAVKAAILSDLFMKSPAFPLDPEL